jgi:hypothetical protein
MNLRAGAAMPDKERLARQIGPCDGRPLGKRCRSGSTATSGSVHVRREWQSGSSGVPATNATSSRSARSCMTASRAVPSVISTSMPGWSSRYRPISCEEAAGIRAWIPMRSRPHSPRRHAGGLHRMVELIDAGGYPLDEVASGLGQSDAARMALEQEDAKVFSSAFTRR